MKLQAWTHFYGCILGTAIGDALAAPAEFLSVAAMQQRGQWTEHPSLAMPSGSDDSQLLCFVLEGLIRAQLRRHVRGQDDVVSVIHHSLLRWLATQQLSQTSELLQQVDRSGWLWSQPLMHQVLSTNPTCTAALLQSQGFGDHATNRSQDCSSLTRSAAFAFYPQPWQTAFTCSLLTHGDRSVACSCAAYALLLSCLWQSPEDLRGALLKTMQRLQQLAQRDMPTSASTLRQLQRVWQLAQTQQAPTPQSMDDFASGHVAEDALAMAIWCALFADDLPHGMQLALHHNGNSGAVAMLCGGILGLRLGSEALPAKWLDQLQLEPVMARLCRDYFYLLHHLQLNDKHQGSEHNSLLQRYPPW